MRDIICSICHTHCSAPGKFEGTDCQVVARALYDITMGKVQEAECGDTETTGWYGLIIGEVAPDISEAYIVDTDSNGCFSYTSYSRETTARQTWALIEAEVEAEQGTEDA